MYEERADATAVALRAGGALAVYLAGRRETAGVDDLIYVGCDALAVLEKALDTAIGATRSER